jgi:hypothetical protein
VKKAGDLVSFFLDEPTLKKAQGYRDLFSSWRSIAGDSIAAHSRIMELERSILMVEADHPGWIQILQTEQSAILKAVSKRFPDLAIRGISFRLTRDPASFVESPTIEPQIQAETAQAGTAQAGTAQEPDPVVLPESAKRDPFEDITDEKFKETLRRLKRHGGS